MVLNKRDLDEIASIVDAKIKTLVNDDYIQSLAEKIGLIITTKYDEKVSNLNIEVESLKKINDQLKNDLDDLQQMSRNKNLRFFGVQKNPNENILEVILNIFNQNMKIKNVVQTDIKRCHRVPSKNIDADKPRPPAILVRLTNALRKKVMINKKFLKSTGIYVQEDLTRSRLSLLKSATEKFSRNSVWCREGNIFVKYNNVVHKVFSEKSLREIC